MCISKNESEILIALDTKSGLKTPLLLKRGEVERGGGGERGRGRN
jgi:hypothetical protein